MGRCGHSHAVSIPLLSFVSRHELTVACSLTLYEAPGGPLRASHLEDWYTSYLWSPIVDYCLIDLPGMTVERYVLP